MAKKTNKSKGKEIMNRIETTSIVEFKKMLIITVSILLCLGIFYIVAGLITGSIDLNKNEPASIQYSEILAGSTFKQDNNEYIVLFYDFSSDNASDFESLVSGYTSNSEKTSMYTVDLSKKFNQSYVTNEDSNKNPTSAKDIKLKDSTLIKISEKKVVEYIEGYENIKNYLSPNS